MSVGPTRPVFHHHRSRRLFQTAQEAERASGRLVFSTSSPMRDVADYRKNAEKCRELAKQMAKPDGLVSLSGNGPNVGKTR